MDTQSDAVENTHGILENLESLIKTSIAESEKKRSELKKLNEMITSFLSQNPTYQEHEKSAKEAARIKQLTKSQLLKDPAIAQTILKAKELKSELRETQTGLSDYLREYQRMSGSNQIEDENGEVREIVYVAKLVKRPSKFK